MKVNIPIHIDFEKNTCPYCSMNFVLLFIFEGEDTEYGYQVQWGDQVHNKGYSFFCPYCGKDFEEAK